MVFHAGEVVADDMVNNAMPAIPDYLHHLSMFRHSPSLGLPLRSARGLSTGEVVAGEVLCGLWNNYSPERRTIAEKPGRKTIVKSRANGGRMEVV